MRFSPWLTILPLLALSACTRAMDEAGGGCVDTYTDLAIDEVSPLGFSANDVLLAVDGPRTETLEWSDGTRTGVTVELLQAGSLIRFVDSEPAPSNGGMELAAAALCEDRLEIDGQVSVVTDDGLLNEAFDVTLRADDPTSADLEVDDLLPDDLAGSYVFRELETADYDTVSIGVHVGIGEEDSWGQVNEFGEYAEQGNGDEGVAMAEMIMTGYWPAEDDTEDS